MMPTQDMISLISYPILIDNNIILLMVLYLWLCACTTLVIAWPFIFPCDITSLY